MDDDILPPPFISKKNGEIHARLYLESFRWPDKKPRCPKCGSVEAIHKQSRNGIEGYYRCTALHPHPSGSPKPLVFTVRTGTILERSHVPLDKWLYCFKWYVSLPNYAAQKVFPIPAIALASRIDVNRKTASAILKNLHALRWGLTQDDEENQFLLAAMAATKSK